MAIDDRDTPMHSPDTLTRIADLLGCSVASLSDGVHAPLDLKGASELLTIWVEMESDADRERLLLFARNLRKAQ